MDLLIPNNLKNPSKEFEDIGIKFKEVDGDSVRVEIPEGWSWRVYDYSGYIYDGLDRERISFIHTTQPEFKGLEERYTKILLNPCYVSYGEIQLAIVALDEYKAVVNMCDALMLFGFSGYTDSKESLLEFAKKYLTKYDSDHLEKRVSEAINVNEDDLEWIYKASKLKDKKAIFEWLQDCINEHKLRVARAKEGVNNGVCKTISQ